ncbi:MAG: hypothetical protein ACKPKO_12360, partial [Candidatus Fonsibacter sp.]
MSWNEVVAADGLGGSGSGNTILWPDEDSNILVGDGVDNGTARTACVVIEPVPDEDSSVFIQPENGVAVAAAAASSSDEFIPRHVVIKILIKQHQDNIEKFDNEIGSLIDRLLMRRDCR